MCFDRSKMLGLAIVIVGLSACQTTKDFAGSEISYPGNISPIQGNIELRHRAYEKVTNLYKSSISITAGNRNVIAPAMFETQTRSEKIGELIAISFIIKRMDLGKGISIDEEIISRALIDAQGKVVDYTFGGISEKFNQKARETGKPVKKSKAEIKGIFKNIIESNIMRFPLESVSQGFVIKNKRFTSYKVIGKSVIRGEPVIIFDIFFGMPSANLASVDNLHIGYVAVAPKNGRIIQTESGSTVYNWKDKKGLNRTVKRSMFEIK